jgi:3-phosphoshikimate 1-carboxyvinyltransferase
MPADKSISHRLALLGALAQGTTEIANYSTGADCQSTLNCLSQLGVAVKADSTEQHGLRVRIEGCGVGGLKLPDGELDAGNSGTTMRLLAGILAGEPIRSVLTGDESLRRRPMQRIIEPLARMGARIESQADGLPPLAIEGGALQSIEYKLPVASAQVKSAVLLAGLHAEGTTVVEEPVRTRDHTEIALEEFGATIERQHARVTLQGRPQLQGRSVAVPGDISAAAFFLVAAALLPESNLMIPTVGLNPTRTALLDFLAEQGAAIKILDVEEQGGELHGRLHVRGGGGFPGGEICGALTARLIDELPVLAVFGTQAEKGLQIRDAAELRVKESDRIRALVENLRRMGAEVEEFEDGFAVVGKQQLKGAVVESYGDHRIAMAMAVAALVAEGETTVRNAECVDISFPGFFGLLETVRA